MAGFSTLANGWVPFACTVICMIIVVVLADSSKDDFIDPLDMFSFDAVNMKMKDKTEPQQPSSQTGNENIGTNEECPKYDEIMNDTCLKIKGIHETATVLLRQYSMSLVRLMESQISSTNDPTLLDLRVSTTYHGLAKLRDFGEGSNSDFHGLHETLTSLIQYAKPAVQEPRYFWLEDKLGLSLPMMIYITVMIISFLLLVVAVGHLHVTKALIWRSLFIIFIISVVMTMVEMYQGKVAEQKEILMTSVRKHCPKAGEMSFWERLSSFLISPFSFESDECKKFMEAMLVNPVFTVSPMQAVSVALVKTIVTPMDLIGQGIKNFLVGMLKGLPVHVQAFVLICLFCLLILWPLLLMGYNFNLFYLINIGPQRVVTEIQYVKSDSSPGIGHSEHHPSLQSDTLHQAHPDDQNDRPLPRRHTSIEDETYRSCTATSPALHSSSVTGYVEKENLQAVQGKARTSNLDRTSSQCDSGDINIDGETVCNTDISAALSSACGDSKGNKLSSDDLCHKLAQVDLSQDIPSKIEESQDIDTHRVRTNSGSVLNNVPRVAQEEGNLTSAELFVGIHKLKLQETNASVEKTPDGVSVENVLETHDEVSQKIKSFDLNSEQRTED